MAIPQIDGRRRRSERSRGAIVQSMLDLLGEQVLEPTAQQISERAGLDITTVFRHFSDMESLYRAMGDRLRTPRRRSPVLQQQQRSMVREQRLGRVRAQSVIERAVVTLMHENLAPETAAAGV